MELRAVLPKDEIVRLTSELLPLDVTVSRRPRRRISFGPAQVVDLVQGAGLRLGGAADVVLEWAGLPVTFAVRRWQMLLVPRVVQPEPGVHLLAFEPNLEALDVRRIPGFVDDRVTSAINEVLDAQRPKLVWNFGRMLTMQRPLSDTLSPGRRLDLGPTSGEVSVTGSALILSIRFQVALAPLERAREVVATARSTPQ